MIKGCLRQNIYIPFSSTPEIRKHDDVFLNKPGAMTHRVPTVPYNESVDSMLPPYVPLEAMHQCMPPF